LKKQTEEKVEHGKQTLSKTWDELHKKW